METRNQIVDIIIPVYSGLDESLACINSVLESISAFKTKVEVVVIFDAGPDLKLRDELLFLASEQKITLLINEKNQGFVSCVNKGINRTDRDVVLLNSDTLVANDWLDRIVNRAYISTNIATVTPFSNNAEICSWPIFCQPNTLYSDVAVEKIDSAFARLSPPPINIPTAVGFCMFIKRDCIGRIGVFDVETFGRGYGEENDFCMRASALSYTHVLATDVYVHHYGGVSFGSEKKTLELKAIAKLDKLYPAYKTIVAEHIEEDPAGKWRYAAELVLQRMLGKPLVLHITHGAGGGTDKHVLELSRFCNDDAQHAMLVPQADCMQLIFPNVINRGLFEFPLNEMRELKNFLFSLSLCRIHIHHVMGLESLISELLATLEVSYYITLHDYYFLHSNYTLTDSQGYFRESKRQRDAVCAEAVALPDGVSGESWRERWHSLLNRAERVFAPSNATAKIYNAYHPELSIVCAYHPDHEIITSYPEVQLRGLGNNEQLHIAVLGGLSVMKGADLLEKVAQLAMKKEAPIRFTLIGYAYKPLADSVETLGAYDDEELPGILNAVNPHVIWFPCTWPETYSYTLSCAIMQGYPVICPQLGAFQERLQNRPHSWLESWRLTPEQWLQRLLDIRKEFETKSHRANWDNQPESGFSYAQEYKFPKALSDIEIASAESLMTFWKKEATVYSVPETSVDRGRLLAILVWINNQKLVKALIKLVPLSIRHAVKMRLSSKPLHD